MVDDEAGYPLHDSDAAEIDVRGFKVLGTATLVGTRWAIATDPRVGPHRIPVRTGGGYDNLSTRLAKLDFASLAGIDVVGFLEEFEILMARKGIRLAVDGSPHNQPYLSNEGPIAALRVDDGRMADGVPDLRRAIGFTVDASLGPIRAAEIAEATVRRVETEIRDHDRKQEDCAALTERTAVVGFANLLRDREAFRRMLEMPAGWKRPADLAIAADGGVSLKWSTFRHRLAADGTDHVTPDTPNHLKGSDRGSSAWIKTGDLRFNGNNLMLPKHIRIPMIIEMAAAGMPLDAIIDHPAVKGSGLVIESVWHARSDSTIPRMRLRRDAMRKAEALELGWSIIDRLNA